MIYKILKYLSIVPKLGYWNVSYMIWYRLTLKFKVRRFLFPVKIISCDGVFFRTGTKRCDYPLEWKDSLLSQAERIVTGIFPYYSYHWKKMGKNTDWFVNPFNGERFNSQLHWTLLSDFDKNVGDIKNVWEVSRFSWVATLSRAYAITEDDKYFITINNWLKDWCQANPLNIGPNWKCGQEAAIRVINLINSSLVLGQHKVPEKQLCDLVNIHLSRIDKNIRYSIVQDNNHGTSEAAGLFIGGLFLVNSFPDYYSNSKSYVKKGKRILEDRVKTLISGDGCFSQHSTNYHRLMLDTISFCEYWRKEFLAVRFSASFYNKAKAATLWLYQLTDLKSGNTVNLGANDGALLNVLNSANYRDYQPTLQLAFSVFFQNSVFDKDIAGNESLFWLSLKNQLSNDIIGKSQLYKSGYCKIQGNNSWALVRFPYFKFRPSHNDSLHFDLWINGKNVICDAGSYSYNPPENEKHINLTSVKHHNTVCFDNKDQMPKVSRFLLAEWLKTDFVSDLVEENGVASWGAGYTDRAGNKHIRYIKMKESQWTVEDTISGNFKSAIIGFNIDDELCRLDGRKVLLSNATIEAPDNTYSDIEDTIISQYYFQKRTIKRLNIKVDRPGTYKTIITINNRI